MYAVISFAELAVTAFPGKKNYHLKIIRHGISLDSNNDYQNSSSDESKYVESR